MTMPSPVRKPLRSGIVLTIAALMALTGCSSADPGAGASSPAGETINLLPAAEGETEYPLTLETPWGETVLEERPERIAAVTPSQDDVEILAALGVTPYLASEFSTDVWVEEALETPIPERFTRNDEVIPVEQVAAADPDLIIVLGTDLSEQYDKLSAIAPVLATAEEGATEQSVANEWSDNVLLIGEILDLKKAAENARSAEAAAFAELRAEYPQFDGVSASYVVYYGESGGLQFHSSIGSPAAGVLEQLGFEPAAAADALEYRQMISTEKIGLIDADVILFAENSNGSYTDITEQPLFQQLQAVQNDHLVLMALHTCGGSRVSPPPMRSIRSR